MFANAALTKPSVMSMILDDSGEVSILKLVEYRKRLQSGTMTRSERIIRLNPKFALAAFQEEPTDGKISLKEASHRLRLAQDLDSGLQAKKPQKYREMIWKNVAKQIEAIVNPQGPFVFNLRPSYLTSF